MRKKILIILTLAIVACSAYSQSAYAIISSGKRGDSIYGRFKISETVPVKVLADYRSKGRSGVLDVGTYTKINDAACIAKSNEIFDGHSVKMHRFCSCCIKEVGSKEGKMTIFGRNMDLPNSFYPVSVFWVNEPGKYRSFNMAYSDMGMETFDQIANNLKMAKEMHDILPYGICDGMNERGLVIEVNMRYACPKLVSTGTNPGAKIRICEINLTRYLIDHCANIHDVLETVSKLDIYTANNESMNWPMAFAMMDATGRYGVLEFVSNKPVWHEGHPGQVNSWIDKNAYKISNMNCGLGRWDAMMKRYPRIETMQDMRANMENIWYSQLFTKPAREQSCNPVTENIDDTAQGTIDAVFEWKNKYDIKVDEKELARIQEMADEQRTKNIVWTTEYVTAPQNREKMYAYNDFIMHAFVQLPFGARKLSGIDECSDISYVVNSRDRVMEVKFFEQPKIFRFTAFGMK